MLKRFNFLGQEIRDGKIYPSTHAITQIDNYSIDNIRTVKQLRGFLGFANFLAKFLYRSTAVFDKLRQVATGASADLVKWTPELVNSYHSACTALKKITHLHPFRSELSTFVIVDSSKEATGAICYQKAFDEGPPKIVGFFSRKRRGAERKIPLASCYLELAGLVAAATFWRRFILAAAAPVTFLTDSESVAKLCARYAKNLCPSDNAVINKFFMDLGGLSLNVIYTRGTHAKIAAVDFISRAPGLPECNAEGCQICLVADFSYIGTPVEMNKSIARIVQRLDKDRIFASQRTVPLVTPETLQTGNDPQCYHFGFENVSASTKLFSMNATQMVRQRTNYTLPSFLGDVQMLVNLQQDDTTLRRTLKHLRGGLNVTPRKHPKVRTLIDTKGAFTDSCDSNLVVFYKQVGEERYKLIPLPTKAAKYALNATHESHGHMSPTQFFKAASRHFHIENMRREIETFISTCKDCSRQRREAANPAPMKEVPIPSKVCEEILVDEVHRTTANGTTAKFLFATESITKFGVLLNYKGGLTSEKFVNLMKTVKDYLLPGTLDATVSVRADGAKGHSAGNTVEQLRKENMQMVFHQSTSHSPNKIPEMDARIEKLSRHLNLYMSHNTIEEATRLAIRAYNNTVGDPALGYSPVELWLRRSNVTMIPIMANDTFIVNKIKEIRLRNREAKDRALKKRNLPIPPLLQPISPLEPQPIQVGDIVKLYGPFEKNELKPLFKVIEVNWEFRYIMARRTNLIRLGKLSKFKFAAISRVIRDFRDTPRQLNEAHLSRDLGQEGRQRFKRMTACHPPPPLSCVTPTRVNIDTTFLLTPVSMTSSQLTPRKTVYPTTQNSPVANEARAHSGAIGTPSNLPNQLDDLPDITPEGVIPLPDGICKLLRKKIRDEISAKLSEELTPKRSLRPRRGIPPERFDSQKEDIRQKARIAANKANKS